MTIQEFRDAFVAAMLKRGRLQTWSSDNGPLLQGHNRELGYSAAGSRWSVRITASGKQARVVSENSEIVVNRDNDGVSLACDHAIANADPT